MSIGINTKGRFVFKPPFVTYNELIWNVTAIREISDFGDWGIDVYEQIYKKVGLVDGTEHNGKEFNFAEEIKNNPVIYSLQANDGTIVYIPENFIASYPNMSEVPYSRIILSCDLGGLPDYVNLDDIREEVENLVNAKLGLNTKAKLIKGPFFAQPTVEEHEIMEASRVGSVKVTMNTFTEMQRYKKQAEEQQVTIQTLTSILRERGIL